MKTVFAALVAPILIVGLSFASQKVQPAKAPLKASFKASVQNADGGVLMLSSADRQAWIAAQLRVDQTAKALANATTQAANAVSAQSALWATLKANYPGLVDGDLIDARTGEVSTP